MKDENPKPKKKDKKQKMLTTLEKSFDTFVNIATNTSSVTLSVTGIGLIAIPKSAATSCGLAIGIQKVFEIILQKYEKYKKQDEEDRQKIKSFDKLCRKSLQNNIIDESEKE